LSQLLLVVCESHALASKVSSKLCTEDKSRPFRQSCVSGYRLRKSIGLYLGLFLYSSYASYDCQSVSEPSPSAYRCACDLPSAPSSCLVSLWSVRLPLFRTTRAHQHLRCSILIHHFTIYSSLFFLSRSSLPAPVVAIGT
jgi:hypothetical protein